MTIPATEDYFLVQNMFGMASGLSEDVVVNTFIFRNTNSAGTLPDSPQERGTAAVRDFFITAPVGSGDFAGAIATSPMGLLSAAITTWTQKVYDLGSPPGGRAPQVFDRTSEMVPRSASSQYPPEVAICVSLQTPIIGKRGKGRFYLGPCTAASAAGTTTPHPSVAENVRKRLALNAANLALGNGMDMEWAVWSTTRSSMERVVGGWVDDAFDTQRRRGIAPASRTKFGTTVPTVAP